MVLIISDSWSDESLFRLSKVIHTSGTKNANLMQQVEKVKHAAASRGLWPRRKDHILMLHDVAQLLEEMKVKETSSDIHTDVIQHMQSNAQTVNIY